MLQPPEPWNMDMFQYALIALPGYAIHINYYRPSMKRLSADPGVGTVKPIFNSSNNPTRCN